MKILLVGAGGYAALYVDLLLKGRIPDADLEGIVEPYMERCVFRDKVFAAKVPVYATIGEFYSRHSAELAVISTPPFLHREQCIEALSHDSNVLCEKPVAPTVEEAWEMLAAEERYGRFIAVGYQWYFSDAIQSLKQDVLDGLLGKPISLKTAISWPRDRAYYQRGGGWGGKITYKDRPVFDSVASNACAHFLHNMLFLLGERMDVSARVDSFEAECYRANDIESFDTCSIAMKAGGASLYFAATHAADRNRDPEFVYRFERAVVTFTQSEHTGITAVFDDGSVKNYGDPFADDFKKLADCIAAVREGRRPICTVATALPHTELIGDIHAKTPIRTFAPDFLRARTDTEGVYVEGLYERLYEAYDRTCLLSKTHSDIFASTVE